MAAAAGQSAAENGYIRCLAVVDFDIDVGQVCSAVCPPDALSHDERSKIAYLALPDSNVSTLADVVYCFRLRSDAVPLFAASALSHRYSYGCAYFRQQRDPSSRRGFRQKSVVVVSDTPYVGLLKQVASTLGPLYFDTERAMENGEPALHLLEAACAEVARWPQPVPGVQLYLPLLGSLLQFSVPWVSLHSFAPALGAAAPAGAAALAAIAGSGGDSQPPGDGLQSGGPTAGSRAGVAPPSSESGGSAEEAAAAAAVGTGAATAGAGVAARRAGAPAVPPLALASADGAAAGATHHPLALGGGVLADSDGLSPATAALRAAPPLTMNEVFAAKSLELPGLFQELGLYSVFRGLVPSLWHLWELAITGQPVLVMGPSPEVCGDAVLAIVSLISPLEYCADFRPYFTLYDPDFQQIAEAADAHWGTKTRAPKPLAGKQPAAAAAVPAPAAAPGPGARRGSVGAADSTLKPAAGSVESFQPPLLVGTTNPFFTKSLALWPNALWLGSHPAAAGAGAVAGVAMPPGAAGVGSGASSGGPAATSNGATSGRPSRNDGAGSRAGSPRGRGGSSSSAGSLGATGTTTLQPHPGAGPTATPVSLRSARKAPPSSGGGGSGVGGGGVSALLSGGLKGYSATEARPRVVPPTAPLADHLPGPGQETVSDAAFIVRAPALVAPDKSVLKQLLRVRPQDEDGRQLRIGGVRGSRSSRASSSASSHGWVESSSRGDAGVAAHLSFEEGRSAGGGEIPAVVINNAVLRQHFRQLTFAFLRPFDKYFHIDPRWRPVDVAAAGMRTAASAPAGSAAAPEPLGRGRPIPAGSSATPGRGAAAAAASPSTPSSAGVASPLSAGTRAGAAAAATAAPGHVYGPYDDLPALLLPRFSEEVFLEELAAAGGPRHKTLRACARWRELYVAFIHSPHFFPWFHARRRECARQLHAMARVLRMALTRQDLLAAAGMLDVQFRVQPGLAASSGGSEEDATGGPGGVRLRRTSSGGSGTSGGGGAELTAPSQGGAPAAAPSFAPSSSTSSAGASGPPSASGTPGASPLLRVVGRGMPHAIAFGQSKGAALAPRPSLSVPSLTLPRPASAGTGRDATPTGTPGSATGSLPRGGADVPTSRPDSSSPRAAAVDGGNGGLSASPASYDARANAASPAGSASGASMRSLTSSQLARHEAASVELHGKISACLARERGFLEGDEELLAVMQAHLAAVESVMPPRLVPARARERDIGAVPQPQGHGLPMGRRRASGAAPGGEAEEVVAQAGASGRAAAAAAAQAAP